MEQGFDDLDAPVLRVTNEDVPLPYAANLEKKALIDAAKIVATVKKIARDRDPAVRPKLQRRTLQPRRLEHVVHVAVAHLFDVVRPHLPHARGIVGKGERDLADPHMRQGLVAHLRAIQAERQHDRPGEGEFDHRHAAAQRLGSHRLIGRGADQRRDREYPRIGDTDPVQRHVVRAALAGRARLRIPAAVTVDIAIAFARIALVVAVGILERFGADGAERRVAEPRRAIGAGPRRGGAGRGRHRHDARHHLQHACVDGRGLLRAALDPRIARRLLDRAVQQLLDVHLVQHVAEAHHHQRHHRKDDREFDEGDAAPVATQPRQQPAADPHFDTRSSATWFAIRRKAASSDALSLA
ncbi:hypothetical protein WR25_22346 [Diploscapter pachys]|uniref:Uncharacterized protein n=1 Tax=Diploscapter pachys TaxID=2018661 RepID=A0A2A2M1U9_9BILA|nr:hypothetical protein WR25_22346 [Diploscapter pachys]